MTTTLIATTVKTMAVLSSGYSCSRLFKSIESKPGAVTIPSLTILTGSGVSVALPVSLSLTIDD